jgi:hypothetical protein
MKRISLGDYNEMTSFGTFKPVGYSVLAYADEAGARAAVDRFRGNGFAAEDLLVASSREIFPRVSDQLDHTSSSITAAQGYEVVLMKRYLQAAMDNAWWLFVWSPETATVEKLKASLGGTDPLTAVHYGRLLIEDLQ